MWFVWRGDLRCVGDAPHTKKRGSVGSARLDRFQSRTSAEFPAELAEGLVACQTEKRSIAVPGCRPQADLTFPLRMTCR